MFLPLYHDPESWRFAGFWAELCLQQGWKQGIQPQYVLTNYFPCAKASCPAIFQTIHNTSWPTLRPTHATQQLLKTAMPCGYLGGSSRFNSHVGLLLEVFGKVCRPQCTNCGTFVMEDETGSSQAHKGHRVTRCVRSAFDTPPPLRRQGLV